MDYLAQNKETALVAVAKTFFAARNHAPFRGAYLHYVGIECYDLFFLPRRFRHGARTGTFQLFSAGSIPRILAAHGNPSFTGNCRRHVDFAAY